MNKNYKLIKAREDVLRVTQQDFAAKIPMDKTAYGYKENGKRKIWIHEANKIINTLNQFAMEKGVDRTWEYDDIFLD